MGRASVLDRIRSILAGWCFRLAGLPHAAAIAAAYTEDEG